MTTIAFVGLGNMGGPMAANLVKAGHTVLGFDLVSASCETARAAGVRIAGSGAEAVREADVVVTMLPAGKHVLAVWAEVLPATKPGALMIDSSTIDVESARKVHGMAKERSCPCTSARRPFSMPAARVVVLLTAAEARA